MKIYLPVYNTVVGSLLLGDLEEMFVEHQQALEAAMLAFAHSDIATMHKTNALECFTPAIAENAVAHAKKIIEILDIRAYDYLYEPNIAEAWFSKAVWRGGREYVFHKAKWYERTWKKSVIKAPLRKQGVVFLKDWTANHPTAGLSILTDKKNLRTLTYGMSVEKQSKQIVHAAERNMKTLRADKKPDGATLRARASQFKIVEDQFVRDRGLKINEAVKEIVKEARLLLFVGPVTKGDASYYEKNGINEIQKRLDLIAFQTRYDTKPVEVITCDARMVRSTYNAEDKGHTAIAVGLAGILDGYAKLGKL